MQTIRHYLFASVKNFFLVIVSAITFAIACAVADWLLSGRLHNGLIIVGLSFASELALLTGVSIFLIFGYKAIKLIREEQSPSEEFVKMVPTIIIWLCALLLTINYVAGRDITDCQKFNYNGKLNGGTKVFDDKKYIVSICGSGVNDSHFFNGGMDSIQLTITDEKGDELAKRHYKVSWESEPGHEPLIVERNRITYQDDETQKSYIINMPPTLLDWIKARVPLFRIWG